MTKYIEIDRAIETALLLLEEGEDEQTLAYNAALVAFVKNMEIAPAADVQEARHGRWVRGDEMADYPRVPYKPWETYCSCCGEIKEQRNDGFCGNCGAEMDGGDSDDA